MRWLEITPDYRCNNRCVGCFSVNDTGPSMTPAEIVRALDNARRGGTDALWLGGGEPTLRRDLFGIVAAARARGFSRIKLQTNGMMVSYPVFADRCAKAGITEVSFGIRGANAETHDRLSRTPGCFALLCKGVEQARAAGLVCEADVLTYASNHIELPDVIDAFAPMGVTHFRVWLLSAAETNDPAVRAEVPRFTDWVPSLCAAHDRARERGVVLDALHTPACVLPRGHRDLAFDIESLALTVVNPGGHAFALADSPIEGGHYPDACAACSRRPRCRGVRDDYVALFGSEEFQALGAEEPATI